MPTSFFPFAALPYPFTLVLPVLPAFPLALTCSLTFHQDIVSSDVDEKKQQTGYGLLPPYRGYQTVPDGNTGHPSPSARRRPANKEVAGESLLLLLLL